MLILKLLLNLKILSFYLKIKEIFFWINVIIVKKKIYVLFIINLNILLKITKIMLIKIKFQKEKKLGKKKINKHL